MEQRIRTQLQELAEESYRAFASALIPEVGPMMGVRLPHLRALAKQIARGDWAAYLVSADGEWFEEVMLQGMVIGYIRADVEEVLQQVAAFVPRIDNWSVCDSFCSGLKITAAHRPRIWQFLKPYLRGAQEYELRFGVVMLLNYYVDEEYIEQVLAQLDQIRHDGYYVKMAVAWAVSVCFARLPERTMVYLQHCSLDQATYSKALQKIVESRRVSANDKEAIRAMRSAARSLGSAC